MFDYSSTLPQYLRTDEVKLRQVLINLINNAIKFTSAGGVSVRVKATNNTTSPSMEIEFEIEDTGAGISPEELNNLFQSFVQTKTGREKQEGTGLGLAISQQFIELMGGEITVSSQEGVGTIFKFNIPVKLENSINIEKSQPSQRVLSLQPNEPRYRILVADDNKDNRLLLIQLLSSLDLEVKEASNGQEAIEIWHQWQPHLIWMDMRISIINGYEATKYIKSHPQGKQTVIIAMSTSGCENESTSIISTGCDDCLPKPYREADIFEMMNKHIGVCYLFDESINTISENNIKDVLTPEAFATLPDQLLDNLLNAAMSCESEAVDRFINEIGNYNSTVSQALAIWSRNFEYDKIIDLIETNNQ